MINDYLVNLAINQSNITCLIGASILAISI